MPQPICLESCAHASAMPADARRVQLARTVVKDWIQGATLISHV
jgi:hypothetical protein